MASGLARNTDPRCSGYPRLVFSHRARLTDRLKPVWLEVLDQVTGLFELVPQVLKRDEPANIHKGRIDTAERWPVHLLKDLGSAGLGRNKE